jgi:choline dehydrogenase-like flavoprotein
MHSDARSLPDGTHLKSDLCVVGAGAAGITIAKEFADTKFDVTLLESGGFTREPAVQSLYEGTNTGLPYFPLQQARLRYFGGTTNHWSGLCAPLDPIDFKDRDWVPESGWPLSLNELDPFYRRAHPVCDLGAFNYDLDYWKKQSDDFSSLLFEGPAIETKLFKWSAPTRFGDQYRSIITQSDNLTLWTHANVTGIQTAKDDTRVDGLHVQCLNGKAHHVEADRYVLACGGLENPRLLLANNIGNETVGRYFMEHPHVRSGTLLLSEWPSLAYTFLGSPPGVAGQPFALLSLDTERQREHALLNYTCCLLSEESNRSLPTWMYGLPNMRQFEEYLKYHLGSPPPFTIQARIEQRPNPDSRVTLSDDTDALGQPKIELHWTLTDQEKRTIRVATETLAKEVGQRGIGRVQISEWLTNGTDAWPDFLHGGWHHMGTTRMSESETRGVVDSNCRVHGMQNLFVAGSSVYPTSGTANPTLTLVALAIRLADHLKTNLNR